jgi:hypothetical protein
VLDSSTKVLAKFADGAPAAFEHAYGRGYVILLGTFVGQFNESKPVPMHPLGEILVNWAELRVAELQAPASVEVRELEGEKGKFVFLFNHGEKAARVEFAEEFERRPGSDQEIVAGSPDGKFDGKRFFVNTELPAESVRIWRLDY